MLPLDDIPAPGFKLVSGKARPLKEGQKYMVQFRNGFVDRKNTYSAPQLQWIHRFDDWDVVAVRSV